MKIKDKSTQKRDIKVALENNGWKIEKLNVTEWWENDVWQIESTWSPIGKKLFLIFENDPMSFDEKIIEPWALSAFGDRPKERNEINSFCSIVLNNKWKNNLPDFFNCLSEFRQK